MSKRCPFDKKPQKELEILDNLCSARLANAVNMVFTLPALYFIECPGWIQPNAIQIYRSFSSESDEI
jgi:hypothetical protein